MMENVIQFYENYDEEGRLFRSKSHLREYLTTIRYFDRLFEPGSRILDACAGTGRYAYYLANKGHIVTACDLVERNVDIIKSKPDANKLAEISVCNTTDLSRFESNSFDIVLCMGALYHLNSKELQEKVISECVRVCKSGGIVVLAYIIGNTSDDKYKDIFISSKQDFRLIKTVKFFYQYHFSIPNKHFTCELHKFRTYTLTFPYSGGILL